MHAACIALALLAPAGAAIFFRRRINAWSLWLANLKLEAALALLCAVKFPELSYLFFAPALAGLIAVPIAIRGLRPASAKAALAPLAVALPVVGAAFTFTPIVLMLYPALGADAWPVITALFGLVVLGMAPILTSTPSPAFRLYAGVAALSVIFGAAYTLWMPAYSAQMPQRTLLWYLLDADSNKPTWLLQPDSKRLPPLLALHAAPRGPEARLPAGPLAGPVVSAAPPLDLPAPELQILGVENRGNSVLYHLHVRSLRNAPEIELALAENRRVEATLDLGAGHKLPAHFWATADGSRWLQLIGVPPEGMDLTLETSGAGEAVITLLDRSYGVQSIPPGVRGAHPSLTTQSQDGDLTIVHRAVRLSAN